jgi:hypothetical protein
MPQMPTANHVTRAARAESQIFGVFTISGGGEREIYVASIHG